MPKAVENSAAAGILIVSTISPNKEEFEQVVRIPGEEGNDHIFHDKKQPASIARLNRLSENEVVPTDAYHILFIEK